jgi:autophagy-related protein 2
VLENINFTVRLLTGNLETSPSTSQLGKKPPVGLELKLTHLNLGYQVFSFLSFTRLRLRIKEVELLDHLDSSEWSKFLTSAQPSPGELPRETSRDVVKLEFTSQGVKGIPEPEHALRVALYPLRLHVDQDSLDFLVEFLSYKPPAHERSPEFQPVAYPDETFFSEFFFQLDLAKAESNKN